MSDEEFSVFHIEKTLKDQITAGDLNGALTLIRKTVERVFNEPLCTARVLGNEMLDGYCCRIGAQSLQTLPVSSAKLAGKIRVYLVTKLQKSGGHTRVIEDLIRTSPKDYTHVILSTELVGKSDRTAIEKNLKGQKVTFAWSKDGNAAEKLVWLQSNIRNIAPDSVWLFNHHEDSIAVAAAQRDQGYQIYFYHHGDHHMSLGLFLPGSIHIDPLPMGFHDCRGRHGLQNFYLPLWMQDHGPRSELLSFMQKGVTTCTAANANKVEVPYFIHYIDMIPDIIAASGGRHIHIGKLTPWGLWRLKRGLKKHGIDPSRFVYIPWVPSVWKALQEHQVDLYLVSFPNSGARTMIEAMGSGTPMVAHDHYGSHMMSSIEVAYPEAFTWRDPDALYAFLKNLSAPFLEAQSQAARAFFLTHHDEKLFQNLDLATLGTIPTPALRPHRPDWLQWGLEVTRQVSLFGLIWRFFYSHRRLIKKLFFC